MTAAAGWRLPLLVLLLATACGEQVRALSAPLDAFYYPTGISLRKLPGGKTAVVVASSNFDLNYDQINGGTLIAIDPDASGDTRADPNAPLAVLGSTRIGSMGGEVVVVDADTCPGWTGPPEVLVASRSLNDLYQVQMDDAGALTCGDGCVVPLDVSVHADGSALADSYGITLACRQVQGVQRLTGFISFLRSSAFDGYLEEVDLTNPSSQGRVALGSNYSFSSIYDDLTARLYVTSGFIGIGSAPLRWLDLAGGYAVFTSNLYDAVVGSETRGIGLSNPRAGMDRRAYVALRIYDADSAAAYGVQPTDDVSGGLAIIQLTEEPGGQPSAQLARVVPLDRGVTQVRVLPARAGKADLVAVTSPDDDSMVIYDDDTGSVARTFHLDANGYPELGHQPFGMAVEQRQNVPCAGSAAAVAACDRIYVGSFDRGYVSVVELDPDQPDGAAVVKRVGRER